MASLRNKLAATALALSTVFAAAAPAYPQTAPEQTIDYAAEIDRLTTLALANEKYALRIVPNIIKLTGSSDPAIRAEAAYALEYIGRKHTAVAPQGMDALKAMTGDTHTDVAREVHRAIANLGRVHETLGAQAIELLNEMAANAAHDIYIRHSALQQMSSINVRSETIAAAVIKKAEALLKDPDPDLRITALTVIWGTTLSHIPAIKAQGIAAIAPSKNDPEERVRLNADRYTLMILCTKPNLNECLRP